MTSDDKNFCGWYSFQLTSHHYLHQSKTIQSKSRNYVFKKNSKDLIFTEHWPKTVHTTSA